jgi:hypothetical protein
VSAAERESSVSRVLVVVFSRDRAMQLDAVLRSFYLHCEDPERAEMRVLFSATTERHARQYLDLRREHSQRRGLTFVRERGFRSDLLGLMATIGSVGTATGLLWRSVLAMGPRFGRLASSLTWSLGNSLVLFLVDDNIFVRPFRLATVERLLSAHPDALGMSLRLGKNTSYCYPLDRGQRVPEFSSIESGVVGFNWPSADADFGYPLEVSSSVYRMRDVLPFLARLRFRNPNTLEQEMSMRTQYFRESKPLLLSYEMSVTFCNPLNKVQSELANRANTDDAHSSDNLAELFTTGRRIDVRAYAGVVPTGCHEEMDLRFEPAARTPATAHRA